MKIIKLFKKTKPHNELFGEFKANFQIDNPLKNFPVEIDSIQKLDPTEFFGHADIYSYWLAKKLLSENRKRILDLGSRKGDLSSISISHDITALVLSDPSDPISEVKWIKCDAGSEKFPFPDKCFDIFTSTVSLHTMGLTRYGDNLNPNALIHFANELNRVMKDKAELIFTLTYGHNFLKFNRGFIFDLPTIKQIFSGWNLEEYFIDNASCPIPIVYKERLTKDLDNSKYDFGNHRTIFLHFKREL